MLFLEEARNGFLCSEQSQCSYMLTGAECRDGVCGCFSGYTYVKGRCRTLVDLGERCTIVRFSNTLLEQLMILEYFSRIWIAILAGIESQLFALTALVSVPMDFIDVQKMFAEDRRWVSFIK